MKKICGFRFWIVLGVLMMVILSSCQPGRIVSQQIQPIKQVQTLTPLVVNPMDSDAAAASPSAMISPSLEPVSTGTPMPLLPETTLTAAAAQVSSGCIPVDGRVTGRVTRVYDGDTIEVNMDGKTVTVRYIGLDAPEIPYGLFAPEAATRNKNLVFGEQVTLIKDVSDTDTQGRLLRYVLVGDRFINYEMLLSGFADIQSRSPDIACAKELQLALEKAASRRAGMWANANTIRPTEYVLNYANPSKPGNCDPSYPGICIPPSPPDLDCWDITFKNFTVLYPDPHYFDIDQDGIGCDTDN